jgi:hypothetical protein
MNQVSTRNQWDSITIAVNTPNGKMYVTILDDAEGRADEIIIHAGKTGGAVHAWAASLSRVMTSALQNGAGINDLIADLSSQTTSERAPFERNGVTIRSGPEGVCYALMQYRKMKYRELRDSLGASEDDDDEPKGRRPAKLGNRRT